MAFLRNTYRPWTILWVIQRFIVVMKEGRLPQIRLVDLLYDLRLTRKVRGQVRNRIWDGNLSAASDEPDIFNFLPSPEYKPFIINDGISAEALSMVNRVFDRVYVINLGRRPDRRVEMIQKLKKYRVKAEIFEAENGYSKENAADFAAYYDQPLAIPGCHPLEKELKKKMIASPGAWGYLITWKNLLSEAKRLGFSRILVFDDDVIFHKDFERNLEDSYKHIPSSWKLLYLGATQHDWGVPYHVNYPEDVAQKDFEKHPFYHPVKTDGSFAVGIDSSVYDDILRQIEPMNCAFDSGPLRWVQQYYPGQCFVMNPNLVVADVTQSDIGVQRNQEQMAKKLRWDMALYDYPFRKELVSVIMPAYNAERTIEKSIRSILGQTYRELEMIVADDGSTDKTASIVEKLAKEDSRVKLVRLDSNQGCYPARNAALRAAKGKYIAIQDSDDISLSTRIEAQLIPLMTGKALFTLTRILRSRCTADELDITDPRQMIQRVLDRRTASPSGMYEYRDKPVIGFMSCMLCRELFEELGLFWEHRFGADAEFLERVLFHKAGILLSKKDGTIHTYLMDRDAIPGIYQRIDKVQLISTDMTGDNITNRHSQEEKEAFETLWRKKLKREHHYIYPKFTEHSDHLINTYFDRIYVLNLKHRTDKRLKSLEKLGRLGINVSIVDAVDGYEEPHKSEYEEYKARPLGGQGAHALEKKYQRKMITSPGGWGVLKSKKIILLDALKNNFKRILILQDDIIFIKDFHKRFEDFINSIDDDWKIIGLGATQYFWKAPDHISYDNPRIGEYDPLQPYYHPYITDGAFALGYDRSVFAMLIKEIDRMNCSFDSGPVRAVYAKFRQKCYISQPNLVIADVRTSDIREGRDQEKFARMMKWEMGLYEF